MPKRLRVLKQGGSEAPGAERLRAGKNHTQSGGVIQSIFSLNLWEFYSPANHVGSSLTIGIGWLIAVLVVLVDGEAIIEVNRLGYYGYQ